MKCAIPFVRITRNTLFFSRTAEQMLLLVAGDRVSFYTDGRHYMFFDPQKGFHIMRYSKRPSYALVIHNTELCLRLLIVCKSKYLRIGDFVNGKYMLHPMDRNYYHKK